MLVHHGTIVNNMPELPEVETVVRTLEHQIQDLCISDICILYPSIIDMDETQFKDRLLNQHFRQFHRRGKYCIFQMDDCYLWSHLRMEGKYFIQSPNEPISKHVHVIFSLSNGTQLRYHDTRKFGRMAIVELDCDFSNFRGLGPEPMSEAFNATMVKKIIKNKNTTIKQVLLDQSFVAGIGNIYADEICHACRILPHKKAKSLTKKQCNDIVECTRIILQEAIRCGGTTIRSYTSSLGVTGLFQLQCKVHGLKVCQTCQHDVIKSRVGGRGTYYCPTCQR